MSYLGLSYGDISPRVGVFAVGKFLAHAQNQLVLEKFAQVQNLPKNKGQTIKWRRSVPFEISTTALTEGVTPAPQGYEVEDVSAVISQYGAWVELTDVIMDTHEDPVLSEISANMGEQAAAIKEAIIWGVLRAGTNVVYSGSATSRATVTAPSALADFQAATRELRRNHAKKITKMLSASDKVSTEPVNASFIAVGHSDLDRDIRELPGFVEVHRYGTGGALHPNELGKIDDIRFILTPHLTPFTGAGSTSITGVENNGTNVNVYPVVVLAQDAYGVTALGGMSSVSLQVGNPGKPSPTDPLGQRGFVSWKMWFVATRLNENWMVRVEAACTSL